MNKYLLAANVGVILILISGLGSYAYAQSVPQSGKPMIANITNSSTTRNMTATQVQNLLCPDGQVCLTLIATQPLVVDVGDTIVLNALVTNNSPNTIHYIGGCKSSISAIFDDHVVVHPKIGCNAIVLGSILPHQSKWIKGPGSLIEYEAVQAGFATSIVTFTYNGGTHISKGFPFVIFPAL